MQYICPFQKHDRHDTMETYAQKFIPFIDTTKPFNIVANSMGGIMTMELIKHIPRLCFEPETKLFL